MVSIEVKGFKFRILLAMIITFDNNHLQFHVDKKTVKSATCLPELYKKIDPHSPVIIVIQERMESKDSAEIIQMWNENLEFNEFTKVNIYITDILGRLGK